MSAVTDVLSEFLKVLSDKTRLEILFLLRDSTDITSKAIQDALGKSQSTISQHLITLEKANLIEHEQLGASKQYRIKDADVFDLFSTTMTFISKISQDRLNTLTALDVMDTLS